ncbi:FMN-dependent NADH-azoreductase [Paenibacillus crassostreae]|uniref:FMN dependent NADH:quinone oxidoreductase n=1 Tax=Paenibacillus crassostreae TaxID=1763538 RepID=A0A167FK45_9BACL|nr:FMN-dependent NADH-azoreductase [Paenibacillus crassostreae]AOZ94320.1 FMN-dependent NADH-azoreductase [Paenibacillus crassostreae]OAB76642.1 FMN-dependent NADH-azoreductase [Paenibacillus crassostreae]
MSKVLFVKANNRPIEQAVSVKLYQAFLDSYKQSHPNDEIVELDLFAENLPYYDNTVITGLYKASQGIEATSEEQQAANTVTKYLDQFIAADKVVFGFPLWNMTVPAVLHTYVDYLNQAGKTFKYTAEGAVGLLSGKKVALLNASGGVYSEGPMAAAEMAVAFMKSNMNLFGVQDITTVIIEGHAQAPDQAATIIESGLNKATKVAAEF